MPSSSSILRSTLLLLLLTLLPPVVTTKNTDNYQGAHMSGKIVLGGLFPIHSQDKNGNCTIINGVLGVQRLEAMFFAIRRINTDKKILPGITLGLRAFDTCASETIALDRTVEEFVTDTKCDSKKEDGVTGKRQVVGVVGPLYSSISVQVAHLLRLFKMPQISYDSTTSELSDKTKYEYFLRTAPSDFLQVRAIVDILKHFKWSYVSAVYSDDTYGRKGIETMSKEAEKEGICLAVKEKVPYAADKKTYATIIRKLLADKQASVVIVYCSKKETIRALLEQARRMKITRRFQWIGSDSWNTVSWLEELQPLIRGLITIRPHSKQTPEFDEYFYERVPYSTDPNPWFRSYFSETVKCRPLSDRTRMAYPICKSDQTLRSANVTIDSGISRTIDAVYAFAHALHQIQQSKCTEGVVCPRMEETTGKELLQTLYGLRFASMNGGKMQFTPDGDASPVFDVYYFDKFGNESYENKQVGRWHNFLSINPEIKKYFKPRDSFCGEPCRDDQVKRVVEGKPVCCWECTECTGNKFAYNETHCQICPRGHWPHSGKHHCVPIPAKYFTLNRDWVALYLVLPPLLVAILGIIAVIFVGIIFIKYNETPLVKASGRELSFLLLTGLFLCYGVLVICLLKPSPYVCLLEFILDSLPFTICYSSVIVKTNRISRIFNRRNLTKRPQFIHPQSQICFAFSLVAVQIMLLTAFCVLQLPHAKQLYLSDSDVVLICAISDKDFLLSQIYNFVLIIICTYYAFKTRRSPMNFNEAKYIAFAMYCTCVLWLAFITVYLVQTDVMLKACIRCLSVSLIATILLVSLFVPKVYIIICKPSENRKRPTLPSHSVSSLNGAEQGPAAQRQHGTPLDSNTLRDQRQVVGADQNDSTLRRGLHRPRSSTDPRRYDNDRKSWRYSLPPEQFSQPGSAESPRKLDREEEMEIEMRALIERLAVLESLLNQQRQSSSPNQQAREIQGALKSCQGLIAEVKKQSTCSIPECIEESADDDVFTFNGPTKPDNRSLLMTYAQSPAENPKTSCKKHKAANGIATNAGTFRPNTTADREKIGLLDYSTGSALQRRTTDNN